MRRKELGQWILMTFWGKDCFNIQKKIILILVFIHIFNNRVSFCIDLNCVFLFFFTRLLNCFNGEGFHFSWGCPKRKIFARSFMFHQSTSCQNSMSLWVRGTNWMQCNFLSLSPIVAWMSTTSSDLNHANVKAWNSYSIWCWSGYTLISSDSIWKLTNLHVCCSFILLWQFEFESNF